MTKTQIAAELATLGIVLTASQIKKASLAALEKGATLDDLMTETSWQKGVVQSAFQYDVKMTGFGVERRADGLYYLIFPKNLKTIPVATPDVSRAESLVAACR